MIRAHLRRMLGNIRKMKKNMCLNKGSCRLNVGACLCRAGMLLHSDHATSSGARKSGSRCDLFRVYGLVEDVAVHDFVRNRGSL